MRGGRYRPLVVHRVRGALDKAGNIAAWDHVVVGQSIIKGSPFEAMMTDGIDPTSVEGASDLPYADPQPARARCTRWRSACRCCGGARSATPTRRTRPRRSSTSCSPRPARIPVEGRLALLGEASARRLACCERVAKIADWGAKVGEGRARGVAVHKSFDSYVAQIAEVSRGRDGLPQVEQGVVRGRLRRRRSIRQRDPRADGRRHRLRPRRDPASTRSRWTRGASSSRTSTTTACSASTRCRRSRSSSCRSDREADRRRRAGRAADRPGGRQRLARAHRRARCATCRFARTPGGGA